MVAGLPPGAAAVINADDAYAELLARRRERRLAWSLSACGADADFKAKDSVQSIEGGRFATRFTLECPLGARAVALQGRRCPQHLERTRRRGRGRRRRSVSGGHRGRPRRFPRGGRPAAAQGGSARQLDHR